MNGKRRGRDRRWRFMIGFLAAALGGCAPGPGGEKLGNGFVDHGIAAPVACSLSQAVTTNGAGREVVLAWLNDYRGEYAVLEIDPDTGASVQVPVPEATGSAFGSLMSSRNKYYKHFGGHFYEYDPAARAFTFWTNTAPGGAYSLIEDERGVIWSVTCPQNDLVSYDPRTHAFKDYGQVYRQNWVQYPNGLSMDDAGWLYWGIGSALGQVIAFDPATGTVKPLIPEERRRPGGATVFRAVNGKVYASARRRDGGWLECHAGEAHPVEGRPPKRQASVWDRDRNAFSDGRRLAGVDTMARVLTVSGPKTGEVKRVSFTFTTEGAHIMGVAAAPDGTICGGSSFPMRFFSYNPATGRILNRPTIGQWNTLASQGRFLYGGIYTGGSLVEWDTGRDWVEPRAGGTNANPLSLGENREVMNRPHRILPLPDGKTVVMAGSPCYGQCGGGLVFWDRETRTKEQIPHTDILPEHTTMSMVALPGDRFLGGSSTRPGSGGIRRAEQAELYIMNWRTRQIEWHAPVFPGAHEYTDMVMGPDGLVYGLVGFTPWDPAVLKYGKRFFIFDPAARQVVYERDTEAEFGPVSYQQGPRNLLAGPDGRIYVLFLNGIARFDSAARKLSLLAESPVPIIAGGELLDGRIYFTSGSRLYSYTIPD